MTNKITVVPIGIENVNNITRILRRLVDDIEKGEYGSIGCCAIALLGDTLEVFSCGPESGPAAAAMVLHAGFNKLLRPIEEYGQT